MTAASAAARLRAASAGSLLVRGIGGAVSWVRASVALRADLRHWDGETARLAGDLSRSRLGDNASAAVDAFARAWSIAAAKRRLESTAAMVRALTPVQRIRGVGLWLVSAALTDLALSPLDPRPVSASRWALWAGLFVAAAAAAAWPGAVAVAWTEWRARRLKR